MSVPLDEICQSLRQGRWPLDPDSAQVLLAHINHLEATLSELLMLSPRPTGGSDPWHARDPHASGYNEALGDIKRKVSVALAHIDTAPRRPDGGQGGRTEE